jgi:hypothetical protein
LNKGAVSDMLVILNDNRNISFDNSQIVQISLKFGFELKMDVAYPLTIDMNIAYYTLLEIVLNRLIAKGILNFNLSWKVNKEEPYKYYFNNILNK